MIVVRSSTPKNIRFEDCFYKELFEKFRKEFLGKNQVLVNKLQKFVPFTPIYSWFSHTQKYSRDEAREILKEWEKRGYIEIALFNGVRIKEAN